MNFFSISNEFFSFIGYSISYIEFFAIIFGIVSVWYATSVNVLTWIMGIVNILLFMSIFYQSNLYADVFLQLFFLYISIVSVVDWKYINVDRPVSQMQSYTPYTIYSILLFILTTIVVGNLHIYLPTLFSEPAAFPTTNSLMFVLSVMATTLLSKKYIETWLLWMMVDIIAIYVYWSSEIYAISILYILFGILAFFGYIKWTKIINSYKNV